MHYVQKERPIRIKTPLGADKLLLVGLGGLEGISRPFELDLDLLSEDGNIGFDAIIGKNVTITLDLQEGKRYWNGFVNRFILSSIDQDSRLYHYRAQVVPWLWFLTRAADCRIFQDKTVTDIIKKVFGDLGFNDYADETQGTFVQREYCVQYRETHFDFVSRLMEEEGIFYFFRHEDGRHTLVMGNSPQAHKDCPNQAKARYEPVSGAYVHEDLVTSARLEQEFRTGKYAHTDFNFKQPHTSLLDKTTTTVNIGGNSKFEVYDFPGEYETRSEGEKLVKVRMQEIEAESKVLMGSSTCRAFMAGTKFTLVDHPRQSLNGSYVIVELRVLASAAADYESSDEEAEESYSNQFTCIPLERPFRPLRITEAPIIEGPQTAFVVGPSGEEIYTDKYGRVKVHFHWDREGKRDGKDTCWIRVSQPWAAKAWGGMWIPRIGQEVMVEYLEGDPDRPIITGRVYNDESMPPYSLPDHMTVSTFKSRSSKGGSDSNYNELRFEDKKGSEQLFMHAEKDMDLRVKNDEREFVGTDRHLIIGNDQIELVKKDKHSEVKMNKNEKIGMKLSIKAGSDIHEKAGASYAVDAGTTIHIKAGVSVVIEAGAQISLKAASSFVDIGPAGVSISGPMVLINSGGAAGSGSGSSPDAPKSPAEADDGTKFTKK
jgi:type VI secretion system secreted protein VgrG